MIFLKNPSLQSPALAGHRVKLRFAMLLHVVMVIMQHLNFIACNHSHINHVTEHV